MEWYRPNWYWIQNIGLSQVSETVCYFKQIIVFIYLYLDELILGLFCIYVTIMTSHREIKRKLADAIGVSILWLQRLIALTNWYYS